MKVNLNVKVMLDGEIKFFMVIIVLGVEYD